MRKLVLLLTATFLLFSCDVDTNQTIEKTNWRMVWSDEFEGVAGSLPDSTKWTYDLGTGIDGWGNQELQNYTKDSTNVALDSLGNLVITARNTGGFTSARVTTKGLFSKQYGRFEARIKTPYGPGIWPAFWMLGDNIDQVGWPQCGEIDIMELRGQEPHIIHGTLHGPGYSGGNAISGSYTKQQGRFDTEFHVFAVEWFSDRIDFYVDDYLYNRIKPSNVTGEWVYNQPFYILMNVAVGGTFLGFPTSATPFPQTMIVDYVRVYEQQ